jgi:hypothetical protein
VPIGQDYVTVASFAENRHDVQCEELLIERGYWNIRISCTVLGDISYDMAGKHLYNQVTIV